jgi:FkbM family methyltransferase
MTKAETGIHSDILDLLREGTEGAKERERTAFDQLAGPFGKSLVLFGAGGVGRKTLAGLRKLGIEPLAFADNNPKLWGQPLNGVDVLSPQEAAARYGKTAAFVVTIWCGESWDRMRDRLSFLRELGCDRVLTFGPLYWKYPEAFLPDYAAAPAHEVHEQADAVLQAAGLWEDEASRLEYLSQIRWRLLFDFDGLADPVRHPIYFPADLCPLIANEVFVDCGAYDGDSLESFLAQPKPGFQKIIAFEPDPESFAKLSQKVSELEARDSIVIHQAATGAVNGPVSFSADGTLAASVGTGSIQVDCLKLDDVLECENPTYIKIDIEGAELDALSGARQTIQKHAPVLAICSYHKQDHVWKIPNLIHSFNPEYRFFLRPHLVEVWDLVCYAIPARRLAIPVRKPIMAGKSL